MRLILYCSSCVSLSLDQIAFVLWLLIAYPRVLRTLRSDLFAEIVAQIHFCKMHFIFRATLIVFTDAVLYKLHAKHRLVNQHISSFPILLNWHFLQLASFCQPNRSMTALMQDLHYWIWSLINPEMYCINYCTNTNDYDYCITSVFVLLLSYGHALHDQNQTWHYFRILS